MSTCLLIAAASRRTSEWSADARPRWSGPRGSRTRWHS